MFDINTDDNILINRFNEGNESAFNILVLKYQKKIYWLVRKMVLDHDIADEITQEVFIKLYYSLKNFRGDSKFFTYIYKIGVNFTLNYLNKHKKFTLKHTDINEDILQKYDTDDDFTQNDEEEIKKNLLKEAIQQLPAQQKAVFNLRFYENLNYNEISEILNKSVGGLKANYFHAVQKIESYIKIKAKALNMI